MINIVFLGAPGSGKGTQATLLSKKLSIPSISTGEILRKEVSLKSAYGVEIKSCLDSGELVSDKLILKIISLRVTQQDCKKGFILDGFPRNLSQAKSLDEMLLSLSKKSVDVVFNFSVDRDTLIKRISGRFLCKGCGAVYNRFFSNLKNNTTCDYCDSKEFENRSDDNEEVVINRLKVYDQSSCNLVDFYRKNSLLIEVDAVKSAPLIFEDICRAISNISTPSG